MSSEKKIAANRRNAKKSTGPKTARGKYHSSFNAVLWGLFSPRILRNEDPEEISKLWNELNAQERPDGVLELMRLQLILGDMMRLSRLERAEASQIDESIHNCANPRPVSKVIVAGNSVGRFYESDDDEEEEPEVEPTQQDVEQGISEFYSSELEEKRDKISRRLDRNLQTFFDFKRRRMSIVALTKSKEGEKKPDHDSKKQATDSDSNKKEEEPL
jgi:hypothetical protein